MAGAGYLLFTAGQVLTAAQVNTYLNQQSVMVFATTAARDAALTSVKSEGMVTYQLDNNDLDIYNGSTFSTLVLNAHGALTTWVPTVTQLGGVTVTNTYSRYQRIGRLVMGWFNLTVSGSGTGANAIIIGNIPFGAANTNLPIGTGELFDSSASTRFAYNVFLPGTTTFDLRSVESASMPDNREGLYGFVAGLAVNDTIGGHFMYEHSADA